MAVMGETCSVIVKKTGCFYNKWIVVPVIAYWLYNSDGLRGCIHHPPNIKRVRKILALYKPKSWGNRRANVSRFLTLCLWFLTFLTFSSLAVILHTTRFNIKKSYVVPTLRLCVLYGSQNKQQLLPHKTLRDWFCITEVQSVYSAVRTESLYETDTLRL
jgi:hypothetical protein